MRPICLLPLLALVLVLGVVASGGVNLWRWFTREG